MNLKRMTWWPIARTLILGVSAGAASGIVAAVITSQSLDNYAAFLLERYRAPDVSVEKPSPIPGTYEEALARVRSSHATLVMFTSAATPSSQASSFVDVDDVLGLGAVVSADGWILTTTTATAAFGNPSAMNVWIGGDRYDVERVVDDTMTEMRPGKVAASDLVALGFGDSADVALSDALTAYGAHPAETLTTTWQLSRPLPAEPLVNGAGDYVGFADDEAAVPLHHALAFVQGVMRSGAFDRAALGAYVVDLATVLNVSDDLRQGADAGAIVLAATLDDRPIVRGGPAAEAGLAARDIITAIDGESVTATRTLAEHLATYAPGQSARLTVLRGGESVTVAVTFVSASDLVY